jgi:curli biogenesis system outer membrane secretion channel CsgG
MKKLLFVVAAVLLSAALTANARVPIGTLAGTVIDAHGQPVNGAAVTIQTSDGLQPYAAHTDASGHFQINRLETGQYDLRASFHGVLSDWTKRIMVHANKTTVVLLHIPPERS